MKWKPLLIGAGLGAVIGFLAGMGQKGGTKNPLGVTGKPNQPFQYATDLGKGLIGG